MEILTKSSSFTPSRLNEDQVSRLIIGSAIEVHRTLGGPGLLESLYEAAMVYEMEQAGLTVEQQVNIPIIYKEKILSSQFRIDMVVNGNVIVECKAVTAYNSIFEAQVLTYLRLSSLRLGLVINFGARLIKNGIHRVVNRL